MRNVSKLNRKEKRSSHYPCIPSVLKDSQLMTANIETYFHETVVNLE